MLRTNTSCVPINCLIVLIPLSHISYLNHIVCVLGNGYIWDNKAYSHRAIPTIHLLYRGVFVNKLLNLI